MVTYPAPDQNPHCQCRGNPLQAFFCGTGHMTECHYPYDCREAGCSHLVQYDWSPGDAAEYNRQAEARQRLAGDPYGYLAGQVPS